MKIYDILFITAFLSVMLANLPVMAYDRGMCIHIQKPDMELFESSEKMLVRLFGEELHAPVWLEDETIIYNSKDISYRAPSTGGWAGLAMMDIDGFYDNDLTSDTDYDDLPQASSLSVVPGTYILYYLKSSVDKDGSNDYRVVQKGDLSTGETIMFTLGSVDDTVTGMKISTTGRFLAYTVSDKLADDTRLMVYDILLGTDTQLDTGRISGICFLPGDETLLYTKSIEAYNIQFYTVSVAGGEPVQRSYYSGGDLGMVRCAPCIHPDGNLVLYTDELLTPEYQETLVAWVDNTEVSKAVYPRRLCVYNLETGETAELFTLDNQPENTFLEKLEYFRSSYGVFSPDGTKICYCGEDLSQFWSQEAEGLYILDFDIDAYTSATAPLAAEDEYPQSIATVINYPNPFNPETTISFTLPETNHAQVNIYNISGQLVRNLANDKFDAGTYTIVWDGLDNHARQLPSGIYLTRFMTGDKVTTDRMTLVK